MPLLKPVQVSRIKVTITDHSDDKPFLVKIEGDESTLLALRLRLRERDQFRGSALILPSGHLYYHVTNDVWENVFLSVFEQYDNVDYKVNFKR